MCSRSRIDATGPENAGTWCRPANAAYAAARCAASDGAQALERLRSFRPDVVVLDMTMPVMSGWTFAEECHRLDGYADLPIVAVTAMHDVDCTGPALARLGVARCLAKPFDVAELLDVVEQLARTRSKTSS